MYTRPQGLPSLAQVPESWPVQCRRMPRVALVDDSGRAAAAPSRHCCGDFELNIADCTDALA